MVWIDSFIYIFFIIREILSINFTLETVWEPPEEGYVSFAEIHKKDQKPPPKPSHKPPKS